MRSRTLIVVAALLGLSVAPASSMGAETELGASWALEQPAPPAAPAGVVGSSTPIGLGAIGDIEFWSPNRGVLITSGNGSTIPAGVWAYDGQRWHELSTVCGGSSGRVVWAGPEEFWTISDGRPGQASDALGDLPPLANDTLCHFAGGQVVASYATPAFEPDSYQEMHAGACFSPSDCWFAGAPLPTPQIGAFQLHYNGHEVVAEPYPGEGHTVVEMQRFDGRLYESVALAHGDRVENEVPEPPVLHTISPEGTLPLFQPIPTPEIPLYGVEEVKRHGHSEVLEEYPEALGPLHLSAGEGALWAAAGPQKDKASPLPGQVTVVRLSGGAWQEVLGPKTSPSGEEVFPEANVVNSIAAEPGSQEAWLALDYERDGAQPSPDAHALVARISTEGRVAEEELPTSTEGNGPKGAAAKVVCPAAQDCWLTTSQGWLFHYANATDRHLAQDTDPAFAGLITYRPPDRGLPVVPPAEPPEDTSGELTEAINYGKENKGSGSQEQREYLPLLSHVTTRLVDHRLLELRFRLTVAARMRLLAKRHGSVVASTRSQTLRAGNHRLALTLDPKRWPTKIEVKSHALAALPTVPVHHNPNHEETISTGAAFLPHLPGLWPATTLSQTGLLP